MRETTGRRWQRDQGSLLAKARALLEPTIKTLRQAPFLFGDAPTLADAALYGNCIMLEEAAPGLLTKLSPDLTGYARRLEARAQLPNR